MRCRPNDTRGPDGQERQGHSVVSGDHLKGLWGGIDEPGGLGRVACRVLETDDVREFTSELDQDVGRNLATRARWNVVDDEWQVSSVRNLPKVEVDTFLGRAAVVRGDDKQAIHSRVLSRSGQLHRMSCVVGADPGKQRRIDLGSDSRPHRALLDIGQR